MKYVCGKELSREITIPKICQTRNRNPELAECCGCPGPIPDPQQVISQKVIRALDDEELEKPRVLFRAKEHKQYLIKKYGVEFYRGIGLV